MKKEIKTDDETIPVMSKEASRILNCIINQGIKLFQEKKIDMDLNKR